MGKYIQKCKVLGDIAVMEVSPVGVRTRARTLALDTAEKRKRARLLTPSPENPSSPSNHAVVPSDRLPSPDRLQESRCSSNGSSELVNRPPRSEDPEVKFKFERNSKRNSIPFITKLLVLLLLAAVSLPCMRETTPSSHLPSESDELESTASPRAGNSRRKPTAVKMPSEEEIEEFFAAAEKDENKRFAEKYNFDVAKEVPLEGRYEWEALVSVRYTEKLLVRMLQGKTVE
ncbi:hypothetical protein ACLOJK_016501 [Asimina triloba]